LSPLYDEPFGEHVRRRFGAEDQSLSANFAMHRRVTVIGEERQIFETECGITLLARYKATQHTGVGDYKVAQFIPSYRFPTLRRINQVSERCVLEPSHQLVEDTEETLVLEQLC